MLYDDINARLKRAMVDKDDVVKDALRNVKSRVGEYLVAKKLPRDKIPDEIVVNVINSYVKSLGKAIGQLEKGGDRTLNLIKEYKAEINVCMEFLPDEAEIEKNVAEIVDMAISELDVTNIKQLGQVMGHIMKNNKGLDGKLVRRLVSEKLGV